MKNIFINASKTFKYFLTIAISLVLVGAVVVLFCGFKPSTDMNSFYEVQIKYLDIEEHDNVKAKTQAAINASGFKVREVLDEDNDYCQSFTFRIITGKYIDENALISNISSETGINTNQISFSRMTNSYAKNLWVWYLVSACIVVVFLFLYGLFSNNAIYGTSYALSFIVTAIITMSLYAVARIEISRTTLLVLITFSAISSIVCAYLLTKVKHTKENETKEAKMYGEYVAKEVTDNGLAKLIVSGVIVVALLSLLIMCNKTVTYLALASIIAIVSAVFSSLFFVPIYQTAVEYSIENKRQLALTRNAEILEQIAASKQAKKKPVKKATKKTAKKDKTDKKEEKKENKTQQQPTVKDKKQTVKKSTKKEEKKVDNQPTEETTETQETDSKPKE